MLYKGQPFSTLNNVFRWWTVLIVTFVVCVAGSAPVFAITLFTPEAITYPLTLLVMGLLAALASSWVSNFLTDDSTHSQILRIVTTIETIAVVLILLHIRFSPNIVSLAVWGAILSMSAYLAAWRFRSSEYNRRRDIIISLVLLALAPTTIVVTIAIASRFGLIGA